jgi:hypothetical protein
MTDYRAFGIRGNKKIRKSKLRRAKSIFVVSHKFDELISKYGEIISAETIVTGNSDFNFKENINLPKSVKLCLLQNSAISEGKKIVTLPIGIENISGGRSGFKKYYSLNTVERIENRILLPPMSDTNPVRFEVLDFALKSPDIFDVHRQYLREDEYFKLSRKYRYIFACEGNGFENHRIWEALYQNSFPIVLETNWSNSLKILGLPILFVKELENLSEELLYKFSEENKGFDSKDYEVLWAPFWKKTITRAEFSSPTVCKG